MRQAFDPEKLQLFNSPALLDELARVLAYPKLQLRIVQNRLSKPALFFYYRSIVSIVEPVDVPTLVERDPDDNRVIAATITAGADAIVSGDDDLLSLGGAAGVPVLRVAEALALFT